MILPYAIFTLKHAAWLGFDVLAARLDRRRAHRQLGHSLPGGMDFFTILPPCRTHCGGITRSGPQSAARSEVISPIEWARRVAKKRWRKTLHEAGKKVYEMFEKRGFLTVAIGPLLPPPFPIARSSAPESVEVPAQNSSPRCWSALDSLRCDCLLGSIYGRTVLRWSHRYYTPILYTLLALAVVGALVGLYYWRRSKQHNKREAGEPAPTGKAA